MHRVALLLILENKINIKNQNKISLFSSPVHLLKFENLPSTRKLVHNHILCPNRLDLCLSYKRI